MSETGKIEISKDELKDIILQAVKEARRDDKIKIDVNDFFAQMQRPPASLSLRHFLTWEFRMDEMLMERARRAAKETYDFVDKEFRNALFNTDQFPVIRSRKDDIGTPGTQMLDLGVYKGASTRALASIFPDHHIHGFDSFEGLPEDWSHAMKGQFGEIKGALPDMPANVTLYKGWFDQTLPEWAEKNAGCKISLLRVDCDIYSSTKTIFQEVGKFLEVGSWICFDELIGYYGWQEHEYKAFMEFIEETGFEYEYVAYGLTYTLVKLTGRK